MREIPLTLLGFPGPLLHAYLVMLQRAELKPKNLIVLTQLDPQTENHFLVKLLPGKFKEKFSARLQTQKDNHWPRFLWSFKKDVLNAMMGPAAEICPQVAEVFKEMIQRFRYENYATSYTPLTIQNLKDPKLKQVLETSKPPLVLYAGRHLVPSSLLELSGTRFVHIHPGYLPEVRGADGALWSHLVHGELGVSCFFLEKGIDTGRMIDRKRIPTPKFARRDITVKEEILFYRAFFSAFDPIMRADFLVNSVLKKGDLFNNKAFPEQNHQEGQTYHFMHSQLRAAALEKLTDKPDLSGVFKDDLFVGLIIDPMAECLKNCEDERDSTEHLRISSFVHRIGKAWPEPLDAKSFLTLENIIRKIEITKKIQEAYTFDWKKIPEANDLELEHLASLAYVLLAYSTTPCMRKEFTRGFQLKCLNAALSAIDLYQARGGSAEIWKLQELAQFRLDLII